MNKKSSILYISLAILLLKTTFSFGQCVVCVDAPPLITCGETATLTGDGFLTSAWEDNFNSGIGALWTAISPGGVTNSTCTGGSSVSTINCAGAGAVPAGDFLWFPPGSAVPRQATTIGVPVPAGGDIIFEFKMEQQSGSCDGPDLIGEGIMLQYNTGGIWQDVAAPMFPFNQNPMPYTNKAYFCPTNPQLQSFTSWNQYSIPIPAIAFSANTQFRWRQISPTSTNWDFWGLDNVNIVPSSPGGATYTWTPGGAGQSITVSPTSLTNYTFTYSNNGISCSTPVIVDVAPPVVTPVIVSNPLNPCPNTADLSASVSFNSCNYNVYLYDNGGDGWVTIPQTPTSIDNRLEVYIDGLLYSTITMNDLSGQPNPNGPVVYSFPVTAGGTFETVFLSGGPNPSECAYFVTNNQDSLIVDPASPLTYPNNAISAMGLITSPNSPFWPIPSGMAWPSGGFAVNPGNFGPIPTTCPTTNAYNYSWSIFPGGSTAGITTPNSPTTSVSVAPVPQDFEVCITDQLNPGCSDCELITVAGNPGIGTFDFVITSSNPLCSNGSNIINYAITSPTITTGDFAFDIVDGLGNTITPLPITFSNFPYIGTVTLPVLIAGSYDFDITTIYDVATIDSCPIYPTINPSAITLVINDPPDAGGPITDPIELCENDPIDFYLPDAVGGTPDINGIWSCASPGNLDPTLPFNGFNYQLDPVVVGAGIWLYQYTVNALPGCIGFDYVQTTVVIDAAPTAGILPTDSSVCLNGPTLDLNSLFNATASCPSCTQPSPFSGTNWTDITAGGTAIANINTWMPSVAGTYILRYTANNSLSCPLQDTEEVTIIVNDPPSATIGTNDLDDKVCLNELVNLDFNIVGNIGNYNISYLDENGTPQNVLVDENSNLIATGNPITIPTGVAGGFTYTIQQIEDINTGCIDNSISQVTLTVVSPPYAGIPTNPTKCEDDFTIYNLNDASDVFFPTGADIGGAWTFGGNPIGGTFQAADNFGNSVDPFGAYTYTVTDFSSVCPDDFINININPEIPPNTGVALVNISICDNDLSITNYDLNQLLDGSQDPGGTWSYNGGAVLNPIDLSGFPSVATYTFTYELNTAAGSSCTNNGNLPYTTICNLTINPEPLIDAASLVINPDPITQGQITNITVGMLVGSPPFTVYSSGDEIPMGTYAPFVIPFPFMIGSGSITPNYDQTLPGGIVTVTVTSVTDNNGCSTNPLETTTVEVTPYPIITATTSSLSICEESLTDPLTPLNLILEATQGVPDIEISFSIGSSNYSSVTGDINNITALNTPTLSDIRGLLTVGINLIQFTHVEDIGGNTCPDSLFPADIIIEVFSTPVIDRFVFPPNDTTATICEDEEAIIQFEFNSSVGQEPFDIIYNYTGSPNIPFSTNTFLHKDSISLVANVNNYTFNTTSFTDANGCIGLLPNPLSLKVNETPIISLNAFIPSEICETHSITLNIGTPINPSIDAPPYTVTLNSTETHLINNDGTETSGANMGNLITFTPNNAGTYPYTITFFKDGNGCGSIDPLNNTAVLNVNETADMIVTSTADTGAICMGEKAYINFDFTAGTSPWVVEFLKDGNLVTLPPYSNNNITIPQGIYNNITSYEFVSVNDDKGCINIPYNKQFDIIANNLPIAELTVDGSKYICDDGSTTNIEFNFMDGQPIYKVNYSVGFDNRYIEFNSPNPPTIPTNESGLWKITKVIDGNNCEANVLGEEVLIQVNPLPYPVEFVAYPQPADINNPFMQFIDNSVGHITAIWKWNDGTANDTLSNNLKWPHEFDDVPDTHFVVLQVISDSGCINSTTQTIIIHEAFSCFIPDAFTPNNDMYNDFYMPITSRVKEYKLSIYDRLGNRVFETNKYSDTYCMFGCDEAWDGTINDSGEYATTGIYIYSIEIIDHNGKARNFEGKIKLIR